MVLLQRKPVQYLSNQPQQIQSSRESRLLERFSLMCELSLWIMMVML